MNSETKAVIGNLPKLNYKNGKEDIQIPAWGKYFIELGELTGQQTANNSRSIIALAVPTRNFCSPLISFGYIATKLRFSDDNDYVRYAEYLKTLPPGTPVLLRSEVGRKYKGLLIGGKVLCGTFHFAIEYEMGSTRFVKIEESRRIEVLQSEVVLRNTQKGRTIIPESDFCRVIMGPTCGSSLVSESSLEIVIIGPKKALENEVKDQEFSTGDGEIGTLQEILRVKEFQSITKSYHSQIISDRVKSTKPHSSILDPPLVIFDGAQSFLKWRNYWKASNWIVVLDRTEYQFDAAVEQINREYILNRKDDNELEVTSLKVPVGIEVMAFWARR